MLTAADVMSKDFIKVGPEDSLAHAIGLMKLNDERAVAVFDGQEYLGIIARRAGGHHLLFRAKLDPTTAKVKLFVKCPPVASPETDIITLAELMYGSYPCAIPVKKGKKILGFVRARDFIFRIKEFPELARLKVGEIMTPNPICFKHDERLGDALSVMREKSIGRAPVVDKDGNVISVLSFTDIIEKEILNPKEKMKGQEKATANAKGSRGWTPDKLFLLDTNIGDAASKIVVTVSPNTGLRKAVEQMYEYKLSDLIVTEEQKPVGIITTRDLLAAFLRLKAPEYWGLRYYGIHHLKPMQAKGVKERVEETFEKIRRAYFKDVIYFLVHITPYEEESRSKIKWSIHLRLATPSLVFTTEYAHFELMTALSWALKDMERKLQEFKVKTRERRQDAKKGRRAAFEHLVRREEIDSGRGVPAFSKLIKR